MCVWYKVSWLGTKKEKHICKTNRIRLIVILMYCRFRSRVLASPAKAPSNLLGNLKSFLPGKPVVHKPTSDEIQHKKEEELRLKKEKEDEARRRKQELQKAKQEEQRQQREARTNRVKVSLTFFFLLVPFSGSILNTYLFTEFLSKLMTVA
jgi:hypothetical protein